MKWWTVSIEGRGDSHFYGIVSTAKQHAGAKAAAEGGSYELRYATKQEEKAGVKELLRRQESGVGLESWELAALQFFG